MNKGFFLSLAMHLALLAFVIFGLPSIKDPFMAEDVIPVELVSLEELENPTPPTPEVKPEPKPEPEPVEQAEPEPEPEPQPQPKPAPAPEPEPAPAPEPEPQPEPEPLKVESPEPEVVEEPEPEPVSEPEPEPEPEPEVAETPQPPKPKARPKPPRKQEPKPEPKKEVVEKKEEPEPEEDALTSILRNVEKLQDQPKTATTKTQPKTQTQATTSSRVSAAEKNDMVRFIKNRMKQCWRVDAGAVAAEDMLVELEVSLNQDGSVYRVDVTDAARMNRDAYFRAAAENARRAIYACAPFQLPVNRYDVWRVLKMRFNPREMFGS